jgi:hypothetical protein
VGCRTRGRSTRGRGGSGADRHTGGDHDTPGTRRAYPRAITLDSGTAITLRFMTAADAAAVVPFAKRLPADDLRSCPRISRAPVVAQWVKNLATGRTITVIADAGGEMAGYASLHHHDELVTPPGRFASGG